MPRSGVLGQYTNVRLLRELLCLLRSAERGGLALIMGLAEGTASLRASIMAFLSFLIQKFSLRLFGLKHRGKDRLPCNIMSY